MKSEIIDFIPEDYSLIHSLFKGDLIDARRYWYQNYDDRYFEAISQVIDHVSKEESEKIFGKNVTIPLYFKYKQFLGFHKLNKSEIERILTSKDIPLHHQKDFYLVEFFRNLNEAYKIHLKTSNIKKSDYISKIEDLSFYIKAASDCFNLWCGSAVIKRGQNMGIEHVEKKEREIRSRGGQGKSKKYTEAKNLAIELHKSGKETHEIAEALIAKKKEDHFFEIPTIDTSNAGTRTLRKWIEKEKKKS